MFYVISFQIFMAGVDKMLVVLGSARCSGMRNHCTVQNSWEDCYVITVVSKVGHIRKIQRRVNRSGSYEKITLWKKLTIRQSAG